MTQATRDIPHVTSPPVGGFDHTPRTRLVFGNGVIDRLGQLARECVSGDRAGPVLLVTDRGLVDAGHADRAKQILESSGLGVEVFADAHENPTTDDVDACVAVAKSVEPVLIVALGGGSALDTAKGCNFIYTNGGAMADYRGVGKASRPMLPLIAVPTTAGTGSETQSFALIATADTHEKMACGDPKAAARVALLDPELTTTQPQAVTAATGIDAIAHAVESFVCTRRNAVSTLYARESLKHTLHQLPAVLADGSDLDARGAMLWGASLAGLAIENSMLGAAHAAANPLTATYGLIHGRAVGVMLPHVIRFNMNDPLTRALCADLAHAVGLTDGGHLADMVETRIAGCGFATNLKELGYPVAARAELARQAATQWTGTFNPRPVDAAAFEELYSDAGLN